ncbi:MAG: hypothetical protein H6R14_1390 [Proteobacteria bacterium]|nr:hypothetical protein [Pseudomonadota bacterium]
MRAKTKPTGHAEIDRQHTLLHELAERFKHICPGGEITACPGCIPQTRGRCVHAFEMLSGSVIAFLDGHVNYEEKLMGLLPGIPKCQEHIRKHKAAHAEFAQDLKSLTNRIDENNVQATSQHMHLLIRQWLGEHATLYDKALLAELDDILVTETEFDHELVSILDHYVFHGRPKGLPSHLHDNDTRQQIELRLARLTPRQREVCALIVKGLANKAIANRLGTTVNTIKTHRAEIYRKLEVRCLLDLVLSINTASR